MDGILPIDIATGAGDFFFLPTVYIITYYILLGTTNKTKVNTVDSSSGRDDSNHNDGRWHRIIVHGGC